MPPIIVRILKPKNGQVRAQIRVGAKADPAKALTEFAEEIRTLFGDSPQLGDEVRCEETEKPTPASVRPADGAAIERAPERSPATPNCTLERTEGEELHFTPEQRDRNGRPLKVDSLKVTDRFLAARPGASFRRRGMTLDRYAQDVVDMGLKAKPDIDRNPYNFVPWIGAKPADAEEPKQATHDTIRNDRLSGRIEVTFTAQTPIFVPQGQLQRGDKGSPNTENNTDNTLDFFHCWNGECDRYAIPGASVKGAVRSLFEALTNSRAGVTDREALAKGRFEMMAGFAERKPEQQKLDDSDPAEATFGFAGKHTDPSHPFRGRLRFGIFWGPVTREEPDSLRLMPITAPSGVKAKAPPLYFKPDAQKPGGQQLRGRKFYWHQRGKNADPVPGVHDLKALSASLPDKQRVAWKKAIANQLPAAISPLPVGTTFTGTLHFTNLTCAELGALLVAVKPDLAFDPDTSHHVAATCVSAYGIKLGKGKPRGLGSVTASIDLRLEASPDQCYRRLDAELHETKPNGVREYVKSYKDWLSPNGRWDELDMAKALKALLRIPNHTSVRVYPPLFKMYGQNAEAMTPAYKLKGP